MNTYRSVPGEVIDGWYLSIKIHAGAERFDFHYHEVEEWLEVMEGEICFVSAGERRYPRGKGQALQIPRGEVHRVEVGINGVKYRMWLPLEIGEESFSKEVDHDVLKLIQKNLEVPEAEDRGDAAFFEEFLSDKLTFHTAAGNLLSKKEFLEREPAAVTRNPSDSIRILHKSPKSVILATVVHTESKTGGPRKSYSNSRLFVEEGEGWRCRIWLNYELQGLEEHENRQANPLWTKDQALELWRYYGGIGGADKNTMVTVASLLSGFSATIIGYVITQLFKSDSFSFSQPWKAASLASLGIFISFLAGYVALLYGGYANWNWEKADEIASRPGLRDLVPSYEKGSAAGPTGLVGVFKWLITFVRDLFRTPSVVAEKLARPCDPRNTLPPVFSLFAGLALLVLLIDLVFLITSLIQILRRYLSGP